MPEGLLLILLFILFILFILLMKNSNTPPEKPTPQVKAKQPIATATAVTKVAPKKPSPVKKSPKKASIAAPKSVVTITPEVPPSERIGLTAGSIWHYLAEHGATQVSKLIKELTEEEKIIQRSIGWLAQEDKITLGIVNRAESITLKE